MTIKICSWSLKSLICVWDVRGPSWHRINYLLIEKEENTEQQRLCQDFLISFWLTLSKTSLFWGTHHRGKLFPVEGAPYRNLDRSGWSFACEEAGSFVCRLSGFISSLVVTASSGCFLWSLLTGMVLNTQRWHEAVGVLQLHQCALTPALNCHSSRSCLWQWEQHWLVCLLHWAMLWGNAMVWSLLISQQLRSPCFQWAFLFQADYILSPIIKNFLLVFPTRILLGFFSASITSFYPCSWASPLRSCWRKVFFYVLLPFSFHLAVSWKETYVLGGNCTMWWIKLSGPLFLFSSVKWGWL